MKQPTIEELAGVKCAQCGRPVDRVDAWHEEGLMLGGGRSVVVFHCHGDTERVEVLDFELSEMLRLGEVDVTIHGEAFSGKPYLIKATGTAREPEP